MSVLESSMTAYLKEQLTRRLRNAARIATGHPIGGADSVRLTMTTTRTGYAADRATRLRAIAAAHSSPHPNRPDRCGVCEVPSPCDTWRMAADPEWIEL